MVASSAESLTSLTRPTTPMLKDGLVPSGPGTVPVTGALASRCARASTRGQDVPPAAAQAGVWAHTASKSAGMVAIVLRHQGSSPCTWYVESSVRLRARDG